MYNISVKMRKNMKEIDNKILKKVNACGNNKTFAKIDNISKIKEGKLPR